MRFIDDKYRLFGLINPIDLAALVAVVLVGVVGFRVLFGTAEVVVESEKPITITIVAKQVQNYDETFFEVGDPVRKKDGAAIGEFVSASSTPAKLEVVTDTGEVRTVTSPNSEDVAITVSGKGRRTADGFLVGGGRLRVNMVLDFSTPGFEATGRVTDIAIEE